MLYLGRHKCKRAMGVVAPEGVDLAMDDCPDFVDVGAGDIALRGGADRRTEERQQKKKSPHPSRGRNTCSRRMRSASTLWAYCADPSRKAPL